MKQHIEWFAKISSADIEFDRQAFIARENNTEKSADGRVLDCIFHRRH